MSAASLNLTPRRVREASTHRLAIAALVAVSAVLEWSHATSRATLDTDPYERGR